MLLDGAPVLDTGGFGWVHLILCPVPSSQLKRGAEKSEGILQRLLRWSRICEGWGGVGYIGSHSFGRTAGKVMEPKFSR